MKELSGIDGWERREPTPDDGLTEYGEVWQCEDDSTEEAIIDRSGPSEPRNWTVILPSGCQRFTQEKSVAKAIAGLYMETGSLTSR